MAKPTRFTQAMMEEYMALGYWNSVTMPQFVARNAGEYADAEAVVDAQGNRLTWLEVKRLSDRIALGLQQLGLHRDQAVLAQLPDTVDNFRIAFRQAGILCAFAPMTLRHTEIHHALKTMVAVAVVIPRRYRNFDYLQMVREIRHDLPELRHVIIAGDEAPEGTIPLDEMSQRPWKEQYPAEDLHQTSFGPFEVSEVLPTSGSTGLPKLCERTEAVYCLHGRHVLAQLKLTPQDVIGIFSPISGGPGLSAWCSTLQVPARSVLLDRLDAKEMLASIQK
ncbi:MAG: AMP-binding protein, partial [Dehalococcoidia bacterium]